MDSLQAQLDEITAQTRRLVQPERLVISERAIAELNASGAEKRMLGVGAKMPEFSLPDSANRLVRSSDLLGIGPLVIQFFRGRWCPYCVTELEAWRDCYVEVRDRGAVMIAISPQVTRQNDFLSEQLGLPFALLTDAACVVAEQFGLEYRVPEYYQQYYRSILVNIPFTNGDQSWRLPVPATYVVGSDGVVIFAEGYCDPRIRPEPKAALAALREI